MLLSQDRTKNAQFVIISLRNNMFELADRLVGIYKTDNATKSVTINPSAFASSLPSKPSNGTPGQPTVRATLGESDQSNLVQTPC